MARKDEKEKEKERKTKKKTVIDKELPTFTRKENSKGKELKDRGNK